LADSREFDFEGVASAAEAAEVLRRLAEGIRARSLSLSLGDEEIGVFPDGELSLAVEARRKRTRAKIEISIAWRRARAGVVDEEAHGQE
jgi:amphi-Trp domain-containing protein